MKLHLRCGGRSETIEAERIGLGPGSSDRSIREVLESFYHVPTSQLVDLVIDRNPDGIVVRPPAVFG
jgi:hypothetical protein